VFVCVCVVMVLVLSVVLILVLVVVIDGPPRLRGEERLRRDVRCATGLFVQVREAAIRRRASGAPAVSLHLGPIWLSTSTRWSAPARRSATS
jgi:hypothetical protein